MLLRITLYTSLLVVLFAFPSDLSGQETMTTEAYIEKYKDIAMAKMKEYRIPASITLAQGILESGSGNSRIAREANNHFGIKCHVEWQGETFYMDDDEKNECFRKYNKAEDSYQDHSLFLTQRDRYAFLFAYETTDFEKWAYGLKQAGYATNPKYPELLIKLIEKFNLAQYDSPVTKKAKKKESPGVEKLPVLTTVSAPPEMKLISQSSLAGRKMYEINGVKLVVAEKGDTYFSIAAEFDMYSWQLFSYNDVDKKHVLQENEVVFIEKKKGQADKAYAKHKIEKGQTLQQVSQIYGIRLSKLLKMNNMEPKARLPEGAVIRLH